MAGIVGYGAYIPKYRIKVEEIARVWNKDPESIKRTLVYEKAVPSLMKTLQLLQLKQQEMH